MDKYVKNKTERRNLCKMTKCRKKTRFFVQNDNIKNAKNHQLPSCQTQKSVI